MGSRAKPYLLSPLAEQDLEEIWVNTFREWSRAQADDYHGSILDAIEGLAIGRKIGRKASDIRPGYSRYPVGRHVLFYRELDNALIIIRILHQRMDLPHHLGS